MDLETPNNTEINTKSNIKWYNKLYHEFMVFLPVLLLLSLITLIYLTYYYKYIHVLLTSSRYSNNNFPLSLTTEPLSGSNKGITLLIISTSLLILLLIALLRSVFMNPGYFEDPTELELNLVLKNSTYKNKSEKSLKEVRKNYSCLINENVDDLKTGHKYLFFNEFSEIINELPLTFGEFTTLNQNMDLYLGHRKLLSEVKEEEKTAEKKNEKSKTKEELKKELIQPPLSEKKDHSINPLSYANIYDNFDGTDLLRLPLCNSCLRWKVERSHHCRQCGKCVLKMDHHCPWLANCIGYRNYKYFCLIHLYGVINCLIIATTFWETVYNSYSDYDRSVWEVSFIIFVYICNIGLLGFLFWLFTFNWTLVFSGQTVIEQSDRERFPSSKPENLYDLGNYRNFTSVFGKNPFVWFIPFFANYEGQGIIYETNKHRKL